MIVRCLKCDSENVTLTTQIPVNFKFDKEGNVKLITDSISSDDIYWKVEYDGTMAICKCADCGHCFSYAEWKSEIYRRKSKMISFEDYLNGFANTAFESAAYETPQFKSFCDGLKNVIKRELRDKYPDLELTTWNKMHFEVSGFITRKSDGAIFYFSIGDVRMGNVTGQQMYRSARHLKDYTGGRNCWTEGKNLLASIAKERYEFKEAN